MEQRRETKITIPEKDSRKGFLKRIPEKDS
jgi:hypothetical protein